MRNKLYKILAAGFALAITFTLSCSDDKGDDNQSSSSNGGSSPSNGNNSSSSGTGGGGGSSFGDKGNDIAKYNTTPIGDKVWMAENLNYAVPGSKCYGEGGNVIVDFDDDNNPIYKTLSNAEIQANCDKYGRLYDWVTAMALTSNCNSTSCASQIVAKHKGICPSGWHIPSNAEWDALLRFVDEQNGGNGEESCYGAGNNCSYRSETAAKYLKATSGWNCNDDDISGNGEDTYDFAALPGGAYLDGSFYDVGYRSFWLSANESNTTRNHYVKTNTCSESAYLYAADKPSGYYVRCVKD